MKKKTKVVKKVKMAKKHEAKKLSKLRKPKAAGGTKVKKVMDKYKAGKLHSGSKKGPKVKNPKQAVAIALSESRRAGSKIKKPKC